MTFSNQDLLNLLPWCNCAPPIIICCGKSQFLTGKVAIFHSNLLNYQRVRLVDWGHQPYLEGKRLGHRSNGSPNWMCSTQNDVGPSCVGWYLHFPTPGIGTVTIPLRTTFWVKLRCLNHVRPKWMIFRSWKQIGKYQQVTCFFPLFGHPTTVSLPHLVLNSCLPSSRRLRWWTISWTWRTTPFRSWGAWCPCLQAGPEFVCCTGSFRRTKIIWEKGSISYITYSVFHRNILDMMFFKIKTQISNLVSLNHIHFLYIYIYWIYWIYISFISSNKSSRSNCELVAVLLDPTDPRKRGVSKSSPSSDARSSW